MNIRVSQFLGIDTAHAKISILPSFWRHLERDERNSTHYRLLGLNVVCWEVIYVTLFHFTVSVKKKTHDQRFRNVYIIGFTFPDGLILFGGK